MLDGYGLHNIIWDAADERFTDILVASAADADGRGISLAVRQDGAAADMTDATVYLEWKHKGTGTRGTTEFEAVDDESGLFLVYYPAEMCAEEGAVQAQIVVSRGDDTYISSRVFTIRVEPVVIGGEETGDGFTLFLEAINAYESATEITTEAATAANAAAELANAAATNANSVAEAIQEAAEAGDYDGADGADGADGFSPIATVTQTSTGATITITDKNGTTSADIEKGAQGEKGDTGEQGPQGIQGETGATGAAGADGVSCTHSWSGTVLTVTSSSGTSSADLVGPQGATGETGPAGADGTVFEPVSPLALSEGELSIDLSGYVERSDQRNIYDVTSRGSLAEQGSTVSMRASSSADLYNAEVDDICIDTLLDRIAIVTAKQESGSDMIVNAKTIWDWANTLGIMTVTTIDAEPGNTASGRIGKTGHKLAVDTLVLNSTTGNLMQITSVTAPASSLYKSLVTVTGLANIYNANVSVGDTYTASSPLSIDANNDISIDLSAYATLAGATFTGAVSGITPTADANFATKKYVDDAAPDLTGYAALAGATFTGAVSGITPTANAHFATKAYVDGAVPDLSSYATQTWVNTQIAAAIADLDDLSEEEF